MNPFELLKNAGQMKEQLSKVQEEIKNIVVEGSSGGKMVCVKLNGAFELLDIKLDPICVDNRDVKMLEDLIVAAHRDALQKIQEELKGKTNSLVSGLNLSL